MRIDRSHRLWFMVSLAILMLAIGAYIPYSRASAQGAKGGSAVGLIYGSAGSALMLFAGLLGLRKKFSTWRVGRAQTWMRGHLWLGTVSFPLILLHSGFHFGFGLTKALMWMFTVVFISGIVGAALQHYMPHVTTELIPLETIYEEIGHVRSELLEKASNLVKDACATLTGDLSGATWDQRSTAARAGTVGGCTAASGLQMEVEARMELQGFFEQQVKPFLVEGGSRGLALSNRDRSKGIFSKLKALLPPGLHPTIDRLENICEEKRQHDEQAHYHRILHGWLLIHIPASYALLLLGAVHAVVALRY